MQRNSDINYFMPGYLIKVGLWREQVTQLLFLVTFRVLWEWEVRNNQRELCGNGDLAIVANMEHLGQCGYSDAEIIKPFELVTAMGKLSPFFVYVSSHEWMVWEIIWKGKDEDAKSVGSFISLSGAELLVCMHERRILLRKQKRKTEPCAETCVCFQAVFRRFFRWAWQWIGWIAEKMGWESGEQKRQCGILIGWGIGKQNEWMGLRILLW